MKFNSNDRAQWGPCLMSAAREEMADFHDKSARTVAGNAYVQQHRLKSQDQLSRDQQKDHRQQQRHTHHCSQPSVLHSMLLLHSPPMLQHCQHGDQDQHALRYHCHHQDHHSRHSCQHLSSPHRHGDAQLSPCKRSSDCERLRSIDPASQAYFHGLLTPELAEERLLMTIAASCYQEHEYEKPDGLFLLRSCPDDEFAVSILHRDGAVTHRQIIRSSTAHGGYRLQGDFGDCAGIYPGPVELIRGHPTLARLARLPCPRPAGSSPLALAQGVTTDELSRLSMASSFPSSKSLEDSARNVDSAILRNLHRARHWFHEDCLDRSEAEQRLALGGHASGDFLVRCRAADGSLSASPDFVLTISWRREPWHYRIVSWRRRTDWLAIEGADRGFASLIELIDHYHLRRDGLVCRLRRAVPATVVAKIADVATETAKVKAKTAADWAFLSGLETKDPPMLPPKKERQSCQQVALIESSESPTPVVHRRKFNRHSAMLDATGVNADVSKRLTHTQQALKDLEIDDANFATRRWTLLDDIVNDTPATGDAAASLINKPTSIDIGILDEQGGIKIRQLRLVEQLGAGRFGEVWRGAVETESLSVQTASQQQQLQQQQQLSMAVRVMPLSAKPAADSAMRSVEGLRHPHLLRLFGTTECGSERQNNRRVLLLMELASLGPADRYLREHPECPVEQLLSLSHQVSQAMRYLESRGLAHRSLSARNLLLFPMWRTKISGDFGLSDSSGSWNSESSTGGRCKIDRRSAHLWHAPEALQHGRFTCRSDAWSFGITCWELLDRGRSLPFCALDDGNFATPTIPSAKELLDRLKIGERPSPALDCPTEFSTLLFDCWKFGAEDRPSFARIERCLARLLNALPTRPTSSSSEACRRDDDNLDDSSVDEDEELNYSIV